MKDAITMTAIGTACLVGMLFLFARRRSKHFSIHQKLNSIMADLKAIQEKVTLLEGQVADFQTALDNEQLQVQTVLESNAAQKVEIDTLKQQLADAIANNDPEALQVISDSLDRISGNMITTKADLESTIADNAGEEPGEEEV